MPLTTFEVLSEYERMQTLTETIGRELANLAKSSRTHEADTALGNIGQAAASLQTKAQKLARNNRLVEIPSSQAKPETNESEVASLLLKKGVARCENAN